jgi:tRNA A-37 threonylcarbamoyl transferase component Bud32
MFSNISMSLHEQGILHGDPKAANVMLHGGQSSALQLTFVT